MPPQEIGINTACEQAKVENDSTVSLIPTGIMTLGFALSLPTGEAEKSWSGEFTFIQAADTQFGMQESYVEKLGPDSGWTSEIAWSTEMVRQVNAMSPRPRFLVICGDLLDAWPKTQLEKRDQQEADFKQIFQKLEVPCICVCGNHDVGNTPTVETVSRYRASFGADYFSFWSGGVFFLVLNTQYWEDSSEVPELAAEHERWLEEQLEYVKQKVPKHVVVFSHIPFFLHNPYEEKEYFNFVPELRLKLLNRLYAAGVRHVFSGHYHRNAGGRYMELEQVVTSAVGAQLGSDSQGYRVVTVKEEGIDHVYKALEDVKLEQTLTTYSEPETVSHPASLVQSSGTRETVRAV